MGSTFVCMCCACWSKGQVNGLFGDQSVFDTASAYLKDMISGLSVAFDNGNVLIFIVISSGFIKLWWSS